MSFFQSSQSFNKSIRNFGTVETLECRQLLVANAIQVIADSFGPESMESHAQHASFEIPDVHDDGHQGIQRIVNGEQTQDYEAVGLLNGDCTATLIGSRFVLTAAHCVENGNGGFMGDRAATFEVGGQTYRSQKITVHPDYDPNNFDAGNDIAIIELRQDVVGVEPMEIMRDRPEVGTIMTLVGFGEGGTSRFGYDSNDNGKQAGDTELERVTNSHIWWNFDSDNEANTAPGDSGGPAIITVGGVRLIAGVTSGGTGDAHQLGDQSFDTRVDVHQEWIDNIVGNNDGGNGDGDGGGSNDKDDDHVDSPGPAATPILLNVAGKGVGRGELETAGDRDVFKVSLDTAGSTFFRVTETNSDVDTHLRVYDADGNLIGENDDFRTSTNSRLKLNLEAGDYFVSAGSAGDSGTGKFRVNVIHKAKSGDGNQNQKTFTNNDTMTIKDDQVHRLVSKLKVAGMSGQVADINVHVDIDHTWMEDLRLVLIAPSGEKVLLSRYLGEDGPGYDQTHFDDEANQSIRQGDAPFRGTYRPIKSLSNLDGIDPNGTWRLVVHDTFELDGGTLNQWKITVTTDSSRQSLRQGDDVQMDSGIRPSSTSQNRWNLQNGRPSIFSFDLDQHGHFSSRVSDFGNMDSKVTVFDSSGALVGQGSDMDRGSHFRGQLSAGSYLLAVDSMDNRFGDFQLAMNAGIENLECEEVELASLEQGVLDQIFGSEWAF